MSLDNKTLKVNRSPRGLSFQGLGLFQTLQLPSYLSFTHILTMILSTLAQSQRIEALHPRFKALFDYIKTHDLTKVPAERITLDGTDLFINVADATLVDAADQKLEVHREYIDIHFPFSGEETVGWTALEALQTESEAAFDTENDFALYAEPAATYFTARPGDFYIMYPEDAHAPIIGKGTLRKAIAKVRI